MLFKISWLADSSRLNSLNAGNPKGMIMSGSELEDFKSRIDLRQYAAAHGWTRDDKQSWGGSDVMRHQPSDDKIIIKRDTDDHYLYVSTRSSKGGSIIDFVQNYRGMKAWGAIFQELRPWIGEVPVKVPSFSPLPKTEKNRLKVEAAYFRMQDTRNGHPYLERERLIPGAVLALDRFAGRIRIDSRSNAAFPHFDKDGLCGYELKNKNFTGFSSGGTKGLWLSNQLRDDNSMVFCEATIDALSYAVLHPDARTRYASVGGNTNPQQPELIRAACAAMPLGGEIVAAMDADAEGRKLAEIVRKAVELSAGSAFSHR